jgi:integrase
MQLESKFAATSDATLATPREKAVDSSMCVADFVQRNFIPNHVEHKSLAGRTHYQAILKHVLKPETVNLLFVSPLGAGKNRLRAVPNWPYVDDVRLCDITPEHIRRLASAGASRGYSYQTNKHIRNVMSAIISHAKRERMFNGENPVAEVELPPPPPKTLHNLTIDQAKTILGLMQYPEREIALITITTGMSISEICALQWKHLNLTGSSVYIGRKFIPPGSIIVKRKWTRSGMVDVDTNRARLVIIPNPVINSLKKQRRRGKTDGPDCFVIATLEGSPISPASVREQRLKPIARKLKIPWLSWQALKRAHESLLEEFRVRLSEELVQGMR